MGPYLVGVDIGGTFTDCVVLDRAGNITATKAPSTPGNFAAGMLDAMRVAAERLELPFGLFCERISVLTHGTTVGTNALIQRKGAKVGLITTKGHEDAIHIMRGSRGVTSRDIAKVVHFPESQKPDPIVPKRLVHGVSERVDCFGDVVVPLNEVEAEAAIRKPRRGRLRRDRDLLAVVVPLPGSRAAGARDGARDGAGPLRLVLDRHRAEMGRVRARRPRPC